jgi:DNA-binding transcriptional LysR family regulator
LTVASEWMFAPELASGQVVPLLSDHHLGTVDCWAVFPAGRSPTARSRAFADFVAGVLARG